MVDDLYRALSRATTYAVALTLVLSLPCDSVAQSVDVGVSGVVLASIQPTDGTYVGGPYLSEGLGGIGPGFGAGVNVIAPNGLVVAVEFTTARLAVEQSGRLLSGWGSEGIVHTSRLRDSLLNGLVGYAVSAGPTRLLMLGGLGIRLDEPTVDGVTRESDASSLVFTGGLDVVQDLGRRMGLVFTGRYSIVRRGSLDFLGVGPQVLRVGAGIRVRLN